MGFEQRKNIIYINVANGSLVWQDKDKTKHQEYAYKGILKSVARVTEDFEGKPLQKVKIEMVDEETGQLAVVKVTDETFYVLGLFQRLPNIDVAKPFILGAMSSDQNEKISFCWMKQDGKKIEKVADFPQPKKVGKFYDWTEVSPAIDKVIAEVNAKLGATAEPEKDDLPF